MFDHSFTKHHQQQTNRSFCLQEHEQLYNDVDCLLLASAHQDYNTYMREMIHDEETEEQIGSVVPSVSTVAAEILSRGCSMACEMSHSFWSWFESNDSNSDPLFTKASVAFELSKYHSTTMNKKCVGH